MLALLFLSASITCTTAAPATPEYLDLLGLSAVELPGLDESALKKLYKRRALELHPDKSSHPDAAGRFRRLQEAYEALKDPSARSYFQRFARYGGSLWQNVKTYADDRLTVERRGWVRSARGMRMSTERVRLNDDFVNMREGAVLPLWHNYAANAFAEHGGPWVLLVADHQDRRGTGAVSAAVGAFAKRFADEPWLEVASVNAGAANNEEFARRLWLAAGHKTRRPLCAVVPPAIDGAVPDRLKDLVVVDCEPTESLPLRLARAARAARANRKGRLSVGSQSTTTKSLSRSGTAPSIAGGTTAQSGRRVLCPAASQRRRANSSLFAAPALTDATSSQGSSAKRLANAPTAAETAPVPRRS
mmetsp:Transcript_32904/g.101250  ORF Transcript_32904/g.101250 Transcript_32904/m.101250 type:complete len:360 (-) Transcript_32904:674-1753(-)